VQYIIVDLEATCWEKGTHPARMEIIEIGAVLLPSAQGVQTSEFCAFVKPVVAPILSDFCKQLTSIRQQDIDQADTFDVVFPTFLEWIGTEEFTICSWGNYDIEQFRTDCKRHNIAFPESFERHINLKQEFAMWKNIKRCGMKTALNMMSLPLEGTHHRGIDDARNIARLATMMLPPIEEQNKKLNP